jgi:ATP-dependent DNA ligase
MTRSTEATGMLYPGLPATQIDLAGTLPLLICSKRFGRPIRARPHQTAAVVGLCHARSMTVLLSTRQRRRSDTVVDGVQWAPLDFSDEPTLVREPFQRAGWIYEEKVDGWRIIAYKDRDAVRLLSRNDVDHTRRFRDIVAAISKLPR